MIGKVIQNYVLLEKIGKSESSRFYKAEHKQKKSLFAIKIIKKETLREGPKVFQFIQKQAKILSKIQHPNIIKFIEILRTTNNYYLVYEYCSGGTLGQFIKAKDFCEEREAFKIFKQLSDGFSILFRDKILHKNLKPSNIMFDKGFLKIADFGFFQEVMKNESNNSSSEPIYLSPEIIKGSNYDSGADIWSLGVIFYEILYGHCPYNMNLISKLAHSVENNVLSFSSEISVSAETKNLLKKMMAVRYRERVSPKDFINIKFSLKDEVIEEKKKEQSTELLKIFKIHRKNMTYLANVLSELTEDIDEERNILFAFLVFKILSAIQKDIISGSRYWRILKVKNNDKQWDNLLKDEAKSLQKFGRIIRSVLFLLKLSQKTSLELETNYIDYKYYFSLVAEIYDDLPLRQKLVNCFLINRHYMLVFNKEIIDFTDFSTSEKTLEEKQNVCKKFAFSNA